jgi:opacity protein-like surface antigen
VRTTLAFSGDRDAALDELSLVARLELLLQPRLTVFAGAGSIVGGTVRIDGTEHHMEPGFVATAGLSWLAVAETARRPFVLGSAVLGFAATHTKQADSDVAVPWRAGDGRIGLAAGKTFGPARPYAVARAFAGPVSWQVAGQSIAGTDRHHYQLGAGLALDLPGHLDADVEAIPLGERALAMGVGYRF